MKQNILLFIIIFAFGLTKSIGQSLNLEYINNWLVKCEPTNEYELVKAFFINGEYVEMENSSEFNERIKKIEISDLNYITYSPINQDNYSPGKGEIYINTKKQKSISEIKELIEIVNSSLNSGKPKVIVMDNKLQTEKTFQELIIELDYSQIYDIGFSINPVPKSIYGDNAENGIIKIWTK
ncbi:hypothetical protein DZC78_00570 [Olleya aquimaris]|uniref:hypothetical protein n=1 Tax=uncultured Olleya sp. TaxID=757243 RepID=UPI000E30FAC4|nr:hypothetical protein [uncultured Olleya sp.]AXO78940.1 hypothetical protein DZC78_00570 [Olleya aquimaris]